MAQSGGRQGGVPVINLDFYPLDSEHKKSPKTNSLSVWIYVLAVLFEHYQNKQLPATIDQKVYIKISKPT